MILSLLYYLRYAISLKYPLIVNRAVKHIKAAISAKPAIVAPYFTSVNTWTP